MKYQIIGKNIKVTDGIRSAVESKLSRMDKYFVINEDVSCRVVVRSYKVGAKIEVTIFTPQMDFRAEVVNDDLYAGVDLAIDKLEGQMRKLKTRMDRSRGGKLSLGKAIALENVEPIERPEEADEVVRTKSIYLEPMSLDEAITRMEAIDHPFFIYLDEEDDRISVCYTREDGGYGVIQAENLLK
jgi:putative sigma-54 modulation protein